MKTFAGFIVVMVIVTIAMIWCGVLIAGAVFSLYVTEDRVVTIQEKLGAHGEKGQYLIIDTEGNVYSVEDNYLLLSFDASNRYAKMHEGGMYSVHTHGIRYPLLSWYPNIMEIQQSVSVEKPCPLDLARTTCSTEVV
jgi:hypothetical protein